MNIVGVQAQRSVEIRQRLRSGNIHPAADEFTSQLISRKRVRLESLLHLQPVLQCSQKMVSVRKLLMLSLADQIPVRQTTQRDQGMRRAQPLIAATESNLQCLGNELNLTNSAPAQFHVEALVFPLALEINLLFREPHVVESVGHAHIGPKNAISDLLHKI